MCIRRIRFSKGTFRVQKEAALPSLQRAFFGFQVCQLLTQLSDKDVIWKKIKIFIKDLSIYATG